MMPSCVCLTESIMERHYDDGMYFREWNVLYFVKKFTEICSWGSNWQQPNIGLNNGLAPNRRQAIIWTNADPLQ